MNDLYAQIQSAANAGATGLNGYAMPTPAQLQSGNYRKGRVRLYGLDIAIETPQGQPRLGKSDGKPWRVICMAHYGDISGTRGADGDPVDCYVGPSPESNRVFVVNQNGKDGAFDEHKVMLAFADEDAARAAYMGSYERGWTGLGSMVSATVDQFRWWLKFGDTTKPFSKNALPYDGDDDMTDITWDSAGMPANSDLATILYGLRLGDREDGLLLDAVQMSDILEDADSLDILDALVVENAKLGMKMEQLQRIMDATGETVKPISMQISEPFKQKGTTNVTALFELSDGQTVAIFFHNPDSTPNKILPQDELVSWKWLLNKKDVTILVAPEKGRDLNPREVARRIMRLAEKNSAKFQKANSARAERLAGIEQAKGAVAEKESTLASLDAEIADLTSKVEAKRATQAPQPGAELGDRPIDTQMIEQAIRWANSEQGQYGTEWMMANLPGYLSERWGVSADAARAALETHFAGDTPAAPGMFEIEAAMKLATSGAGLWYNDPSINHVVNKAVELGYASRLSTTQVQWTAAGIAALNMAKASYGEDGKGLPKAPVDQRAVAVKAELAKLGWQIVKGSLPVQIELHGSRYEIRPAVDEKTQTVTWKDTGGGPEWIDDLSLSDAAMAEKIDREFRASVEAARAAARTPDRTKAKLVEGPELSALGVANIVSLGSENVYIEKDGQVYYTKDLEPDNYQLGSFDFFTITPAVLFAPDEITSANDRILAQRRQSLGAYIQAANAAKASVADPILDEYQAIVSEEGRRSRGEALPEPVSNDPFPADQMRDIRETADNFVIGSSIKGGTPPTYDQIVARMHEMIAADGAEEAAKRLAVTLNRSREEAKKALTFKAKDLYRDQIGSTANIKADAQIIGAVKSGGLDISGQEWASAFYRLFKIDPSKAGAVNADGLTEGASAALKRFTAGRFEHEDASPEDYAAAAKAFLENDPSAPVPRGVRASLLDIVDLADVRPKPIEKVIKEAKKPADRFKVAYTTAGVKDNRYWLNGVHIDTGRGLVVSTDGHRAMVIEGLDLSMVPPKPDDNRQYSVLNAKGEWIEGKFPDWERIIPREGTVPGMKKFTSKRVSAFTRGAIKAGNYVRRNGHIAVKVQIDDDVAFVSGEYLRDMAEAFLKLGYASFKMGIQPGTGDRSFYAESPDGKVRSVIMGLRVQKAEKLFAPLMPDGQEPEVAPEAASPVQSRADWQTAVTEALADSLEIPYSDADGVLEAHAGLLDEQYSKGAAPEDVAKMIEGMDVTGGEPDAIQPDTLVQTFGEWLDAEWSSNRYQAAYLEDHGNLTKAKYAAASGGGDTESAARQQYQSDLLAQPREASIDLRVYDQFDGQPEVQRALVRHFYDLEGRIGERSTAEIMGKKDSAEEQAKQARITAIDAELTSLRAMIDRTKAGTKADQDRNKKITRLENERVALQRMPLGVYENMPAPAADDQSQAARELLQSVIDGTADLDEGLTERLEAVHDQFQGDAEIMALFEQAANAFSDAMVAKAKAALA